MNTRSLDGPIRLPSGPQELIEKVEKAYTVFYKLWNIAMVPKLMRMHKWFKGKVQIQVGDIVYFRKVESELSSKWTVGKIIKVEKGRDEVVRRATVQYQNSNEHDLRETDRAARSLIRLFNIDDESWQEDMDLVEKLIEESKVSKKDMEVGEESRSRLKAVNDGETVKRKLGVQHKPSARLAKSKFTRPCNTCCCLSHCEKNPHTDKHDVQAELSGLEAPDVIDVVYEDMLDRSWVCDETDYEVELLDSVPLVQDNFMSMLCSVNIDLKLKDVEDLESMQEDQTASADNFMVADLA